MYMSFRWYGENDAVTLDYIRQIPKMKNIVSALHDVPVGTAWEYDKIKAYKDNIEAHGLEFRVVESVGVHEDIKLGESTRDKYIENYITSIRNLAKANVEVITYNFMPVFDWTRTDLETSAPDGSTSLTYKNKELLATDPKDLEVLPAWAPYSKDELIALLKKYESIDENKLWNNLQYFLEAIIPVAKECNVKMAMHPDDPPWSVYGLPRIISSQANYQKLLSLVDETVNGICLCTGSLGASPNNNLLEIAKDFTERGRVHFLHARNVSIDGDKDFSEVRHTNDIGVIDFPKILKVFFDAGYDGPIRPDHGRNIWGEKPRAGYGLYDRALGAMYLQGIWDTYAANK